MRLGTWFTLEEMCVTKHKGVDNVPDMLQRKALRELVTKVLDPLRTILVRPVVVTSAFRSTAVNRLVGGVAGSQHTLGQAADIVVPEYQGRDAIPAHQLVQIINTLGLPYDQVINEFGRWVHISYGPKHRREALRAVKGKHGTLYLPFEDPR